MIFDQVSAVTSPVVTAVVLKEARRLLLDEYGGANAAYSLRALSSAWRDQDVVEVRRASDDTTRGFTADDIGDGTLTNWVGTGATDHGYVSTWYDQSGNGNNAVQSATSAQPKIVDAGSLLVDGNGKPKLTFNGSTQLFETSVIPPNDATLIGVANWDVQAVTTLLVGARDSTNQRSYIGQTSSGVIAIGVGASVRGGASVTAGTDYLLFGVHSGSTRLISTNGTPASDNLGSAPNNTTYGYSIGAFNDAGIDRSFMDGSLSEIIIYDSDQSAFRTGIEGNINTEYNIYP